MAEKKISRKRSVAIMAGQIALAAALLFILACKIDPHAIWSVFRLAIGPMFLVLAAIFIFVKFLSAAQMRLGLGGHGVTIGVFRLFQIYLITSFYGLVLPGDLAGGITWIKLGKESIAWARAGMTIVYLRLLNTVILFMVGLTGILFDPLFFNARVRPMFMAAIVLLCFFLVPFFSVRASFVVEKFISGMSRHLPDVFHLRRIFTGVGAVVGDFPLYVRKNIAGIIAISVLINGANVAVLFFAAKILSLQLPVAVMLWLLPVLMLISIFPFSFGGLGIREGIFLVVLAPYAVTDAQKVAFSLLVFTVALVTGGLLGGLLEMKDLFLNRKKRFQNNEIR
jgi:glycosyltransferase 2 family protein